MKTQLVTDGRHQRHHQEEEWWCSDGKEAGRGERRRKEDRSSVGQTESWRAKDKRGEGDRGYWVCVGGGSKGELLRQADREQADPASPETMKWLIWLKHVCEEFWYRGQSGENLRAEESRIYQEHWESTTLEITHTGGCGRPRLTTTYHSS